MLAQSGVRLTSRQDVKLFQSPLGHRPSRLELQSHIPSWSGACLSTDHHHDTHPWHVARTGLHTYIHTPHTWPWTTTQGQRCSDESLLKAHMAHFMAVDMPSEMSLSLGDLIYCACRMLP